MSKNKPRPMVLLEKETPSLPPDPSKRNALFSLASAGIAGAAAMLSRSAYGATTETAVTDTLLFNVLDSTYGAKGDGSTDDTAAIQSAVNAAAQHGGTVYLPAQPGSFYKTTNTITVSSSNVCIRGDGPLSVIGAFHSNDTFQFVGTASAAIYNNSLSDLTFASSNKQGGNEVHATYVANFTLENVRMNNGYNGFYINNYNTIMLRDLWIEGYRGLYRGYLTGGAGGTGRSDVAYLYNCTFGGQLNDTAPNCYGLIIDGFVDTVTGVNVYVLSLGAIGLWIRNSVGATNVPTFISFYSLQSEFCVQQCVYVQAGWRILLSDLQLNGSKTQSNIRLDTDVKTVSISGGFSTGAYSSGIESDCTDLMISNVLTQWNQYAGMTLGGDSNGVVISGCRSGTFVSTDPQQPWACWVNTGANNFAITGNSFGGNKNVGVNNGAGTSTTKIIANNA